MRLLLACVLSGSAFAALEFEFSAKQARWISAPSGQSSLHLNAAAPNLPASLGPLYNFFYANISIGTPPQPVEVILDTGSPATWVLVSNMAGVSHRRYNLSNSKTAEWTNETFDLSYGAGKYKGKWASDYVTTMISPTSPARVRVADFPFGVVDTVMLTAGHAVPGLMGLGPHVDGLGPSTYSTLPEAFYDQEVTTSPAFSVWFSGDSGSIVFGGYDKAKVREPFYAFDSNTTLYRYKNFYSVFLNEIAFPDQSLYYVNGRAILDTGSPITLLPSSFVRKLGIQLGLQLHPIYAAYYTNGTLDQFDDAGSLTFRVGHFSVDIPIRDLFVPGEYVWQDDGPAGAMALSLIGSSNFVLGDVFFQHVYSVLDSREMMVYLAQRLNTTVADVRPLPEAMLAVNGSRPPSAPSSITESTTPQLMSIVVDDEYDQRKPVPAARMY